MGLKEQIKSLRLDRGLTQGEFAEALGIGKSTVSMYENGRREPSLEMLQKMAQVLEVDMNRLTDTEPLYERAQQVVLTDRDQRDIGKKLRSMLELFDSSEALMFDGQVLDEETRELLKASYESQLELTKRMAKLKFNPNKNKQ